MCAEPTKTARASASVSRPQRASSSLPRIEYSSSEPWALTANGRPLAAPTGPPRSTWLAKTRSAGASSRSTAAFASTNRSRSSCEVSWRSLAWTPRTGRGRTRAGGRRCRVARSARRRGRRAPGSPPATRPRRRGRPGSTHARSTACRRWSRCRRAGSRAREGSAWAVSFTRIGDTPQSHLGDPEGSKDAASRLRPRGQRVRTRACPAET